jgi:acetyl-CoA carboxylase biotin carboxylase subunit
MLAKVIVKAEDRSGSVALMKNVLGETMIEGVKTNIPLFQDMLNDPDFRTGRLNTSFVDSFLSKKGESLE